MAEEGLAKGMHDRFVAVDLIHRIDNFNTMNFINTTHKEITEEVSDGWQ